MKHRYKGENSIIQLVIAIMIACLVITIKIKAEPKEEVQGQNETEATLYKEET